VPDDPLLLQFGEGGPALLDVRVGFDRGQRFFVVLRAPGELVAGTADGPRTKSDAGDPEPGSAQIGGCKMCLVVISEPLN
jgi:hypothetical protein